MRIRGLFCGTTAVTNEEYKKVLKRRNVWMAALVIAGALLTAVTVMAENSGSAMLPNYILGVYCGFGTGLSLAGMILFVRNLIIMKDESKLKQDRLENSDERLQEIGSRAGLTAIKFTLLVGTVCGLIAGIFEPVLVKALVFALDVFLFSYIAAFAFYKKKM